MGIILKPIDIVDDITKEEFFEKFKNDELKQAVLKNIKDETLTIYKQGDFEDLCRGPHLPNTRMIRNFKLTRVAGAYLGGDEKTEIDLLGTNQE